MAIPSRRLDVICKQCSRPFKTYLSFIKANEGKFCSRGCAHQSRRGPAISINKQGYKKIKLKGHPSANSWGFMLEHRYVMEKKIGRPLTPKESVHHLDHNKLNNHPDNLLLTTRKDHAIAHAHDDLREMGVLDPVNFKICHCCEKIKSRKDFYTTNSIEKKYLQSVCKKCSKLRRKQDYYSKKILLLKNNKNTTANSRKKGENHVTYTSK